MKNNKIKKSLQYNFSLMFDMFLENVHTFVEMWFFLKKKKFFWFKKNKVVFGNEVACACASVRK